MENRNIIKKIVDNNKYLIIDMYLRKKLHKWIQFFI